ncbi:MAG: calcium/sodium antiporter [Verrucomicrobiaceae bacterium]|nr:calcium/sodium antiporter [Verrucomicrobiaceae bacterium]
MLANLLFIIIGIAFLYFGADWLVGGSCRLAFRLGLTPLVVGLTVVAFGTSAPELVVCLRLNGTGSPNAAVGNVVGSNICNILLILGLSALIRPMTIKKQVLRREMPILILTSLLLCLMLSDGQLNLLEGVGLTAGILFYVWSSLRVASRDESVKESQVDLEHATTPITSSRSLVLIIGGVLGLVAGAEFFQRGGVGLAEDLGVSKAIIGLSILAFGTSLPELATSVVACIKRQGDIIAGNAVGSSIFNILAILGITTLVAPMQVPNISAIDLSVMLGTALLGLVLMAVGKKLTRIEGALMLFGYFAYIWLIMMRGGAPA